MMDDATLATINVDQLHQAVNNLISVSRQQPACTSVPPVSTAGTALPTLPQGMTVASLSQLPTINLSQLGNLPQFVNLLPVSDQKQGVVQTQAITNAGNITIATTNQTQGMTDSQQLQQQLAALGIPVSRIIQTKDIQQLLVQKQQPNTEQTQQPSVQIQQQGQTFIQQLGQILQPSGQAVIQQLGQVGIQQPGQTVLQQLGRVGIQQPGQSVIQQLGQVGIQQQGQSVLQQQGQTTLQQRGHTLLQQPSQALQQTGQVCIQQQCQVGIQQPSQVGIQPTEQIGVQQPGQVGIQQPGQTVIQAADVSVLTARSLLEQALQQYGNVTNNHNEAVTGPVLDNTGNTIYHVLSSMGLQLQPPAPALQSAPPVLVLPSSTAASTTQTHTTCNSAAVTSTSSVHGTAVSAVVVPSTSSECGVSLQDILPEGAVVQDIVISEEVDGQDKENLSHDQSSHDAPNGLPSLSMLEMILKSSETNGTADIISTVKKEVKIEGIYCVDCNVKYIDACPRHGKDYQIINDSPILSKARMSVPHQLNLKPSLVNDCTTGVFAREVLKARIRFGPMEGACVDATGEEDKTDLSLWRIFVEDRCTKIMNGYDEAVSNWMPFVQQARNSTEQNLVAYQQNQQIFFVTSKAIEAGSELLLWYARDYAGLIDVTPNVDDMSKCKICRKQFPSMADMRQHQKYSHPDMSARKWKCQWCEKAFQTSGKLQIHLLSHMGVKPHKCQYCDKQFTDVSNLRVHILLHTGEKKHACPVPECNRAFTQKSHLQSHMICHTKEKNYSCSYCEAQFGRRSDLKAHEYRHTRERLFTCIQCNKAFFSANSYKRHLKSHTGQRDYACEQCTKAFVTKYHLVRHKKTCKGPVAVVDAEVIPPPKKRRKRVRISDIS
ncbi:PR domain zinc finger protein 4-like [Lineus longissimus]|uniref:PR domain zinc finger protein 4-like n=1 Tax=Lineus longissimus TaxID=88925 RepID=UPI002B4EF972